MELVATAVARLVDHFSALRGTEFVDSAAAAAKELVEAAPAVPSRERTDEETGEGVYCECDAPSGATDVRPFIGCDGCGDW
jgi:hypothetical protein